MVKPDGVDHYQGAATFEILGAGILDVRTDPDRLLPTDPAHGTAGIIYGIGAWLWVEVPDTLDDSHPKVAPRSAGRTASDIEQLARPGPRE